MATYATNDRVGAQTMPYSGAARDGFGGDRGLGIFAEYLKAFVNKDLRTLWTNLYGPSVPGPVVTLYGTDPYESVSTAELPSLFVYRQLFTRAQYTLAPELEIICSQIQVCWIPPAFETLEERLVKEPMAAPFANSIIVAVQRGRDPSFKRADDPDPNSQYEGTFIYAKEFCNFHSINFREGKWSKIDQYNGGDNMLDQTAKMNFPALFLTFDVEESRERSFDEQSDEFDHSQAGSLDLKVSNDDGASYPNRTRIIR
jgi:hypothetical protein